MQAENSKVIKFTAHIMSEPSTDHIPLECGTREKNVKTKGIYENLNSCLSDQNAE